MTEEYESIMKNDVWEVVLKPLDKTIVTSKWLYKIKHATDGSTKKYKACFVARGFSQKEGIDYDKIFGFLLSRKVPRGAVCPSASSSVPLSHEGLFLEEEGSGGGGSIRSMGSSTSGIVSSSFSFDSLVSAS